MMKTVLSVLAVAWFAMATPADAPAHEIPADVTIQVIVKPEGDRLVVLVRVPLRAMRDIRFPLRGPGYLEIGAGQETFRNAAVLWIADDVDLFEGDRLLEAYELVAARVSIPSNRSFRNYDEAVRHVLSDPLPESTNLHWQNALLDIALEYPIDEVSSRFSIHPRLDRLALRVLTVMRFVEDDGTVRAFQYVGDPGTVRLDPSWYQAAFTFTVSGFLHILDGVDHLLFLLCLVIPFRQLRGLIPIVTAFTVGHSITLIASAMGLAPGGLWFPPFVETLIALSIVYMALENVVGPKLQRRWVIAFVFGLVHGFGFSFALRESLQFAGTHLFASLLSFNIGVELGQLLAVVILIPALELFFRYGMRERIGTIILSALVAHTGWHWMTERGQVLLQYRFEWPPLSVLATTTLQWCLLAAMLAGGVWVLMRLYRSVMGPVGAQSETGADGRVAS